MYGQFRDVKTTESLRGSGTAGSGLPEEKTSRAETDGLLEPKMSQEKTDGSFEPKTTQVETDSSSETKTSKPETDTNMSRCQVIARGFGNKTQVVSMSYTAPFKVMRPFYRDGKASVIVMMASAGILDGDLFRQNYEVSAGGDLMITDQGYTKAFASRGNGSRQHVILTAGEGSTLRYLPHPMIPFPGSFHRTETTVHLGKGSRLILSDIVACGRSRRGERFLMENYRNHLEIYLDRDLIYWDNTLLDPKGTNYESNAFFGGYSHMGSLFLYWEGREEQLVERIRALPFGGRSGVSLSRQGVLVRALADSGDSIYEYFTQISRFFDQANENR